MLMQALVTQSSWPVGSCFPIAECLFELSTMITKASFSLQNWRVGSVTQFNTVIASAITAPLAHFLTDDVFVCFILFMSQIYEVHEV